MDFTKESPVILSVCPGILGLERGLERAFQKLRWQRPAIAAYVEIEAFICTNLVAAMEAGFLDPAPIWTDLKTFDPQPFRERIHFYIGGYPCQPFSVAGKQSGTCDPRHLWPYIQQHVEAIRPVFGFFENVRGHLKLGFDEVYRSLSNMGYAVEPGIFSAEEVGASHQRERLFILAIRKDYLANSNSEPGQPAAEGRLGVDGELLQKTGWDQDTNGPEAFSEKMGNTDSTGFGQFGRAVTVQEKFSSLEYTNSFNRWPARPGEQQYEWEQPRAVEPGVGCTIDGYNFREDLLRAYGNSVVEQTAEYAFLTLLQKFMKRWD